MAIITDEEWEQAYQKITNALTDYSDNINSIIVIYKKIKDILLAHGLEITEENKALSNYPVLIDNILKDLEKTIKDYISYFSDISEAIVGKGVAVPEDTPYSDYGNKIRMISGGSGSDTSALSPINANGFPEGAVIVPKTVEKLSRYWVYNPQLITGLSLPVNLKEIDDYACYNVDISNTDKGAGALKIMDTLAIPQKVTKVGVKSFYRAAEEKLLFSSNSLLQIDDYAFRNNKQLQSINFENPLSSLYLSTGTFANCSSLNEINSENINNIKRWTKGIQDNDIIPIGTFAFCSLSNDSINSILMKIKYTEDDGYLPILTFASNNSLTEVSIPYFAYKGCFSNCNNLSKVTIKETCKGIFGSAFQDTPLTINEITFEGSQKIPFFGGGVSFKSSNEDDNMEYNNNIAYLNLEQNGSYYYYNNNFIKIIYVKVFGYLPGYKKNSSGSALSSGDPSFYRVIYMNHPDNASGVPGYSIFKNLTYCNNNNLEDFFSHVTENSNLTGILNLTNLESDVILPYSRSLLWSGYDSTKSTANIKTITFKTVSQEKDYYQNQIGPGKVVFSNGFNNVTKIKWIEMPNAILPPMMLGEFASLSSQYDPDSCCDSITKYIQSFILLKEIYMGDGAITIYPHLFASSTVGYFYNESSNRIGYERYWYTCFARQFPSLKTIRLPGTIKTAINNCLTPTTSSDGLYSSHALYGGFRQTALPSLTQVILGEGWSLSIELISTSYVKDINSKSIDVYNLNLDPECMITNIYNVADLTGKTNSSLIVTDITIEKLKKYCELYAGTERILLQGTESENTKTIPTYAELIALFEAKNWELGVINGAVARENDYDEYYPKES